MKTSQRLLCWISAVVLSASALPLQAEPFLKVGQLAPLFSGHDQDGRRWSLSHYLGKKYVLVYFYPDDDTAGGVAEAVGLRDNLVQFKQAGVEVVGISTDGRRSHKEFSFKYGLPFPLLADRSGGLSQTYGALMDENKKMDRRISFLIGLDGRILHITDSPDPSVHLRAMGQIAVDLSGKNSL